MLPFSLRRMGLRVLPVSLGGGVGACAKAQEVVRGFAGMTALGDGSLGAGGVPRYTVAGHGSRYTHEPGDYPEMSGYHFPPTAYNPQWENLVQRPPPGKPIDNLRFVWIAMGVMLFVGTALPIYSHKAYMTEHGHRYKDGWDVFHYSTIKNYPRMS